MSTRTPCTGKDSSNVSTNGEASDERTCVIPESETVFRARVKGKTYKVFTYSPLVLSSVGSDSYPIHVRVPIFVCDSYSCASITNVYADILYSQRFVERFDEWRVCWAPLSAPRHLAEVRIKSKDWIRKEVSAVILMTLEFVKDMDMKMRDVHRVERYYYGTMDFGAGRLFTAIGMKFDHMVTLYKNYSSIRFLSEPKRNLRSEVISTLQYMLTDYCELLSLIELFKERYVNWKSSSARWLIRDIIQKYLISRGVFPWNYEHTSSSTPSTKSIKEVFLELRRLKTEKDADLVIKMTGDFIKDMEHKMTILNRIERIYAVSSDFAVASVYDDIQRRFKHMCDLYKQFATVDRYILGHELNDTGMSPDVVVVYQIMLSDYNEILMIMELLKKEQAVGAAGNDDDLVHGLILKQMEKFGNVPDDVTMPLIAVILHRDVDAAKVRAQEMNNVDDERQVHRLAELMNGYISRALNRFDIIQAVKTEIHRDYDRRIAFEKGYIMGDIVETYRKALVFTKKQMNMGRYTESDRIRYMSYVQKAYTKIYHLVHMMHEINPKYGADNTGQTSLLNVNNPFNVNKSQTFYNTSGFYYTKELEAIRQTRLKERNDKVKKEKKLRLFEMAKYGTLKPATVKTTTNFWPMAYGWDIDYYW